MSDRLTLGFFFRPSNDTVLSLPLADPVRSTAERSNAEKEGGEEGESELVEYNVLVEYDAVCAIPIGTTT